MTLLVRFFPVRSREGVEAFTSEVLERGEAMRNFYNSLGVRRETWFYQDSSAGPIVIGVTDVDELEPRAAQYAESEDRFSLWFKQRIYDLSGIDPNETPKGPPSEMIFDSANGRAVDPSVRLVVRAYPVKGRDALADFANAQRVAEGVARETLHLQETPHGAMAIAVVALQDDAARGYAEWFREHLGPPSEQVFEFVA